MMNAYIISIKRIKDYNGKPLSEPEWEYASYDRYAGSMSTGYPCFTSCIGYANKFKSADAARESLSDWLKDFMYPTKRLDDSYDWSSLAIRKIVFHTIEKLNVKEFI